MNDIARTDIITTTPAEDLNTVLQKFTDRNIDSLPVVAEADATQLLGMLDRRAVIAFYNAQVAQRKAALAR
jgi:CIC family chloride channel protein